MRTSGCAICRCCAPLLGVDSPRTERRDGRVIIHSRDPIKTSSFRVSNTDIGVISYPSIRGRVIRRSRVGHNTHSDPLSSGLKIKIFIYTVCIRRVGPERRISVSIGISANSPAIVSTVEGVCYPIVLEEERF